MRPRAVATSASSISAMTTPGSMPPSAMTATPRITTTSEWPNVSRLTFSWAPPCAAAQAQQHVFSIARALSSACQCASPVWRVNAAGIARNDEPASASALNSAGKRRS